MALSDCLPFFPFYANFKTVAKIIFFIQPTLRCIGGLLLFISKTYPSFLTVKEGSTFLTKPLFPQEREDVTALRCSEPLRSKVGGPSKVCAILCGMGPPGDNNTICLSLMLIYTSLRKTKTSNKYIVISSLTLLQIQRNLQRS